MRGGVLLVGVSVERSEELPEGERIAMFASDGAAVILMRAADITAEGAWALGRVLSAASRHHFTAGPG